MKKDPERKHPVSVISNTHVDEETIRKRAYDLYVDRGMEDGRDLEDWFHAEEEVMSGESQATAA
jgi:hypothetical protein